ncbi:MAG: Ig-like domain-containing protein, partial [Candidatus Dojkabacteria bacterium]
TLDEFSVYASEDTPWGTDADKDQFDAAGVSVTYNATTQTWTIDFGAEITDTFVSAGGVTFYIVLYDQAGNSWGSMSPPTAANTFAYILDVINEAPVVEDITVTTEEDISVEITLLATDVNDDTLTYAIVSQPAHGNVTLVDNIATYMPDPDYHGTDSFTYKANDGEFDSNIATVTITVTPVNDAPVAEDQNVSVTQDTSKEITLVATDVENDTLTYTVIEAPINGSLSGTAPYLTYTPNPGFNGNDSFTFKANDGSADSNIATVTIIVSAYVNTPPVAVDDAYETDQNVALEIDALAGVLANDSDVDGDNLKATLKTNVTNGTLVLKGDGSFTYTPKADFCGTDSFVYTLVSYPNINADGWTAEATATITVYCDAIISSDDLDGPFYVGNLQEFNVRLQNPAPGHTYGSLAASVFVDNITLADFSSVEVKHPVSGTWLTLAPVVDGTGLRLDVGPVTSVPITSGLDLTLTFRVNFNTPGEYPVTGTLYDGVIDPTKAIASYADTMVVAGLTAQDFGYMYFGDVMGVSAGFMPVNFTLDMADNIKVELFTGSEPSYVLLQTNTAIDPDAMATWMQFSGPFDIFGTFDYVADGYWINLRESEYGQTAIPTRVLATMTLPGGITLTAENTMLTGDRGYIIDTLDEELASAPDYEYTPPYIPAGDIDFDLSSNTYTGTYTAPQVLAGAPMNDMARYLGALYRQDDATITSIVYAGKTYTWNTSGTLLGSNWEDSTGKTLVSQVTEDFQAAVLAGTWDPDAGFVMTVHDDYDHEATVTFKLIILNTLDDEIASAPSYSYDPAYTYVGSYAFEDATNIYTVTYNDTTFAPGAMNDLARYLGALYRQTGATVASIDYKGTTYTWYVPAGQTELKGSNWRDASGTTLVSVITAEALANQIDPEVGITLTLSDVFHTEDVTFRFVINDTTAPEVVTITAMGADGFADVVASGTTLTVDQGYTVDHTEVEVNEPVTVADGTVVTLAGQPYGTIAVDATGLILSITPYPGNEIASRVGSFVFSVPTGSILDLAGNALETLSVTLVVNNVPPVAIADAYSLLEDTVLTVGAPGVLENDVDYDVLTAIKVTDPTMGALTFNSDGSFEYTPNLHWHGTDSFTYKANDGLADSEIVTVTITVTPVKDQVVAVDDEYETDEDTTLTVAAPGVLANDIDVDLNIMTAGLVTDVQHGSLTLSGDGSFVYVPEPDFHGTDSFKYQLVTYPAPQSLWTDTATVTITVHPVLDPPALSTDLPASIYADYETEFGVTLDNPANGDDFTGVRVQFRLTQTDLTDITTLEYFENTTASWFDLPLTQDGADVIGWFGPAMGFPMPAPYLATSQFRLTMAEIGTYDYEMHLFDVVADPDFLLASLSGSVEVVDLEIFDITDFGLWGETWPGALSLGWGYVPEFDTLDIASIEVGMLDADRETIIKYTADEAQVAWQRANGYITPPPAKLSSAPFYVEYAGTPIAEGRDFDWTVVFGPEFSDWDPAWGYVKVVDVNGYEEYEEIAYTGPRPDITPPTVDEAIAEGVAPYGDVTAVDMTFTVPQGYEVSTIEFTMSEPVTVATGTEVTLNGVPYGLVTVDATGLVVSITPYAGNEVAHLIGTFTFSIPEGSIKDLAGHPLEQVEAILIVTNVAPVAVDDAYTTDEDVVLIVGAPGVLSNDTDYDPTILTAVKITDPANGTLTLNVDGSFTYTPDADYNGTDTFTYVANDGHDDSNIATVTITVTPVNDAPVAQDQSVTTPEDTPIDITLVATDVDGDPLTYAIVAQPAHGTVTLVDDVATYMPELDYHGPDSFT